MPDQYFVPMKVEETDAGYRVRGQYIVNGTMEIERSSAPDETPKKPVPSLEAVNPIFDLKWIAQDGQSAIFGASNGFDVVKVTDWTYPPPRGLK
ncbi:MAG: hypothetical protein ACP5EN_00690 [Rhodovulum sp.]